MPRPNRFKKPPIKISNEGSISTYSPLSSSPNLIKAGEKRKHP